MRFISAKKEFKFRKLCPYCKDHLRYIATGWEQDTDTKYPRKLKKSLKKKGWWPLWIATDFDCECFSEPEDILSDEWEEWFRHHSDMPYVYQLPVDEKVKRFIEKRFRYHL